MPARRLLVGVPGAKHGRLVEGAPDDLKGQGETLAREPAGHGEGREPEPVEGAREPREAPLALGDLRRATLRGVGKRRRGLGDDRRHEDVGLREHVADERSAETRAQPQGLEIVVRRDAKAQLEACPHDRLDLLRPLADEARVHRGALAPRDDVADVGQDLGIGHAQFRDPRAQRREESDRFPHRLPPSLRRSRGRSSSPAPPREAPPRPRRCAPCSRAPRDGWRCRRAGRGRR